MGIGWAASGTTLFSRALILDNGGSPTTITILSNEYLDIVYEYRVYPPEGADYTGTVVIDSITYDVTGRACNIDTLRGSPNSTSAGWIPYLDNFTAINTVYGHSFGFAYSGVIGTITDVPAGSGDSIGDPTFVTYVTDSFQHVYDFVMDYGEANALGGVRSTRFNTGWSCWQFEFSAQGSGDPIPKDNTMQITFTLKLDFTRATI